ncbi:MAG: hypothetical protein A2Z49_11335 [Chloroflexi bacterium RBG_19FT_COMBO_56_12]|nr:MAG: hypothetical protein A2Z49_11335 [Chloroflexi bacterium RBG_19FT_COMBO_56_12]
MYLIVLILLDFWEFTLSSLSVVEICNEDHYAEQPSQEGAQAGAAGSSTAGDEPELAPQAGLR